MGHITPTIVLSVVERLPRERDVTLGVDEAILEVRPSLVFERDRSGGGGLRLVDYEVLSRQWKAEGVLHG